MFFLLCHTSSLHKTKDDGQYKTGDWVLVLTWPLSLRPWATNLLLVLLSVLG